MDKSISKILIASGAVLVFVIVLLFVGILMFSSSVLNQASAQETEQAPVETVQPVSVNAPITIGKIIANPVVYKDLTFPVEGKIVGWVTKNAILVNEVGQKGNSKSILVIRNQNFGLPDEVPASDVALGETVTVSITGTAGILNIVEEDTGYGDEYSVRELRKWNKKPVIFASSVVQK